MYVIYILLYNGSRYVQVLTDGPISLSVDGSPLDLPFNVTGLWNLRQHQTMVSWYPKTTKLNPYLVISLEKD